MSDNKTAKRSTQILKTGFKNLDNILNGDESNIITISARPSMGKTSFMLNIMLNLLKQNKKCMFFSLEHSEKQIVNRLISQITGIDCLSIKYQDEIPNNEQNQEKIKEAKEKLSKYNLIIFDACAKTTDMIKNDIERCKPEFIFIDYLNLIDMPHIDDPSYLSHAESIGKVMTDLKQMAKDNNCIIFLASQLSRSIERRNNKRPKLEDFLYGEKITGISDIIIFIYRNDFYYLKNDENMQSKTEIIVAKNKNGSEGTIPFIFEKPTMKFWEI